MKTSQAPEVLRRCLLGVVTALVVARPLLAGEDPGRLQPTTGIADLVITLTWLLVALGWAVWRAWLAESPCRVSPVERGLLALGVILFLSAIFSAAYRHPAWLVSWEWLTVLAAFWLVRQLPRSDEENGAIIAVILATAVSLSAHGIYQAVQPPTPPRIDSTVAHVHALDLEVPPGPGPDRRVIRATFAESSVFAGFLTLAAPALLLGCFLAWQQVGRPRWQRVTTAVCCGLVFVAMGMAQWWPAIVALFAVGGVLVIANRERIPQRAFTATVAGSVGLVVLLLATLWWKDFLAVGNSRSEYAGNTFSMLGNKWLLGIGPGNFGRQYPAVVASPASDHISQPCNFLLETLAAGGLLALAAVAYALVGFFRRVWPEVRDAFLVSPKPAPLFPVTPPSQTDAAEVESHVTERIRPPHPNPSPPSTGERGFGELPAPPTRWEFYIGGVFGLTIAFVLQIGTQTPAELIHLAILASCRSLLWFAVFALLVGIPWTARWRVAACTAGVTASLLCLLVTGGFFYPSLAQPLWIMAALAINAVPEVSAPPRPGRLSLVLPVPILAVVWWLYLLIAFLPVVGAARHAAQARMAYPSWRLVVAPQWLEALANGTSAREEIQATGKASIFLLRNIITPLDAAVQSDPGDSGLRAELAYWNAKKWELFARIPDRPDPADAVKIRQLMAVYSGQAMAQLAQAQPLDPYGKPSFWIAQEVRMLFTEEPGIKKEQAAERRKMAFNQIRKLMEADPSDPRLRYRIVEVIRPVKEDPYMTVWRNEAERAIVLDDLAGKSRRCLTEVQRQQLRSWLQEKEEPPPAAEPANLTR